MNYTKKLESLFQLQKTMMTTIQKEKDALMHLYQGMVPTKDGVTPANNYFNAETVNIQVALGHFLQFTQDKLANAESILKDCTKEIDVILEDVRSAMALCEKELNN